MESLPQRTFKNAVYNFISYAWPFAFAIFITPVVIFHLGVKDYGIYIFVNTIISLFGLLDLGISSAVIKFMSQYYGNNDTAKLRSIIRSAHTLFLLLGIIGLLLSIAIFFFGANILAGKFFAYEQYSSLFLIGGITFFVTSAVSVYSIIPSVLQRFDVSARIGVSWLTCSGLTMLFIVLSGGRLFALFLAQLILTTVFSSVTVFYSRKILPLATYAWGWDRDEIKQYYKFGSVAFINNISGSALSYLDRLLIPFFVGPSNLTYYSVPGNVTTRIPGISNTLSVVIFPLTAMFQGANDTARIETLYVRSFRLITIISAALTVTTIAFAYQILLYWLNVDFANLSSHILIILSLTNFILALSGPLSNFLLGLGRLKLLSSVSFTMAAINIILLIVLLPRYGITGAAWAYLFSVIPVGYMFYHTEKKYLALTGRKKYYLMKSFSIIFISFLVWAIDTYVLSRFINDLPTLLIGGGVSFVAFIILYRAFNFFAPEDWDDIERFYRRFFERIKLMITRSADEA